MSLKKDIPHDHDSGKAVKSVNFWSDFLQFFIYFFFFLLNCLVIISSKYPTR